MCDYIVFHAEEGIRDLVRSRGLGYVEKRKRVEREEGGGEVRVAMLRKGESKGGRGGGR